MMNREGMTQPHGKTTGYIVHRIGGGVGTLCYGKAPYKNSIFLYRFATLFHSRRAARRAIDDTVNDWAFHRSELQIIRIAEPVRKASN